MRLLIALYAFGLLLLPLWWLASPESYLAQLDELPQAAAASLPQLQTAAGIHWLKNAYLAFALLLVARYLGRRQQVGDLVRAGWLLVAYPLVYVIYTVMSQVALSPDPEELDLMIRLSGDLFTFCALGLCLVGISRALGTDAVQGQADQQHPN